MLAPKPSVGCPGHRAPDRDTIKLGISWSGPTHHRRRIPPICWCWPATRSSRCTSSTSSAGMMPTGSLRSGSLRECTAGYGRLAVVCALDGVADAQIRRWLLRDEGWRHLDSRHLPASKARSLPRARWPAQALEAGTEPDLRDRPWRQSRPAVRLALPWRSPLNDYAGSSSLSSCISHCSPEQPRTGTQYVAAHAHLCRLEPTYPQTEPPPRVGATLKHAPIMGGAEASSKHPAGRMSSAPSSTSRRRYPRRSPGHGRIPRIDTFPIGGNEFQDRPDGPWLGPSLMRVVPEEPLVEGT